MTAVAVPWALVVVLLVVVVAMAFAARRRRHPVEAPAPAVPRRWRAGDSVMTCGPDLIARQVSPAILPLLGYRPEAIQGTSLTALLHPGDDKAVVELARRGMDSPGSAAVPVRGRHSDGSWVLLEAAARPGAGGAQGAVHFAAREATERARLERWVTSRREMADVVLAMASDAFVGTDADGRIVEWNRAAQSLLGWTQQEAIGRDVTQTIVPQRLRESYGATARGLWKSGSGVDEPVEATLLHRDGHELAVDVTIWIVEVGQTRQFNSLIRDVTARKQVEQALTDAREQAIEASRMKSEFLATMSHEIRTPMNGVTGLAGLMLDTDLDQTQRRYAEGIRTAGAALLSVINDILDFSKAEAGKITLDVVDFDVRDLVEGVSELIAGQAQRKGLELLAFSQPDLPTALQGDPGRLRQVLLNLAGNAVKFTDQGEVVIRATVDGGAVSADGDVLRVRFEVSDTGLGIAAKDRDRMFDAFSQADASTTRRFGGTGLGLAISRRLVDAMGGTLGVDSQLGQGSTFWCEIPLRRNPSGANPPTSRREDLRDLRVLVVDDNATNREILEAQLRAWRMTPTAVDSGRAGLTALRSATEQGRPYDVAILDMAMPEMDGIELARRIVTDPATSHPHLILLTSGTGVDLSAARGAGFSSLLTKPVHQSQLFDSLARALAETKAAGDGSPPPAPAGAAGDKSVDRAGDRASSPDVAPQRGHILLVEDNDISQQVAAAILDRLGYAADVADNGVDAVRLVTVTDYDVVLMDCQMPIMDGYTATGEIRNHEGDRKHTPIIALTASARAEDRDRCLAAGMDDFLSKPFSPGDLETKLEHWSPK